MAAERYTVTVADNSTVGNLPMVHFAPRAEDMPRPVAGIYLETHRVRWKVLGVETFRLMGDLPRVGHPYALLLSEPAYLPDSEGELRGPGIIVTVPPQRGESVDLVWP